MKIDKSLKIETGRFTKVLWSLLEPVNGKIQAELARISTENFSEVLATEVRDNVEAQTMRMIFLAAKWIRRTIPETYHEGQSIAAKNAAIQRYQKKQNVNHAGNISKRQDVTLAFIKTAAASIRDFATQFIGAVRDAKKSMLDIPATVQELKFKNVVSDIIAETIEKKQAVNFAKKKIAQYLFSLVSDASFVQINGRNFTLSYYTDMLTRTGLAKAFTDGTKATFKEYEIDLVEFSKHANPCEICAEFEGNIYSLSGESSKFPPLPPDAEIPVHPNCGHALLPVSQLDDRVLEAS